MENNGKTGGNKFNVEPDQLNNKVTEVNNALILIAGFIEEIENSFKDIIESEIWLGPLAEAFKDNYKQYLESGSSEEGMTTEGGYNAVSASVNNYAEVLRKFLNEASGGYFFADEEAAKYRPLDGEPTTISPEKVNGAQNNSGVTNAEITSVPEVTENSSNNIPNASGATSELSLTESVAYAGQYDSTLSEEQVYARGVIVDHAKNEMGLNDAATAGLLANFDQESQFVTSNEYAENNGSVSYGFAQWNGGRRQGLESFCEKNGYETSSAEAQMAYVKYEMEQSYPGVYEDLKNVENTPEGAREAATIVCKRYERPSNVSDRAAERADFAETYFDDLSN